MPTAFPDIDVLEEVLDVAARAPSAGNAQPWRWQVDRGGIRLLADWTRSLGDSDDDRRDVILSCGAVLHHCAVALAAAGWSSRIQRTPDDTVLAALELHRSEPGDGTLELARAITDRRADRRPYHGALPAGTVELLVLRAERFGVRLAVVPTARWARLGDTEFALRYGDAAPGRAGDDAVMLVLATETDSEAARLRAGEAISDLTLAAASLGLASCPLTNPLKDPRNRLALTCEVFDGEAHPQALIKLGPRPDGELPPAAARRSVAETTVFDLGQT